MHLDATEINEVRYVISEGMRNSLDYETLESITLDAALEFVCAWWEWQNEGLEEGVHLAQKWAQDQPILRQAWDVLINRSWPSRALLFEAPEMEICPAPLQSEVDDPKWTEFKLRFGKSLQQNGNFSLAYSRAFAKALEEMATNVTDHSGLDFKHPAPSVVAYRVFPNEMQFVVADVGRGVLASLQTQSKWKGLLDSRAALDEAVRRGATRRSPNLTGGGFRQVEKSLADLNGHLTYRSGNALLTLDGAGEQRKVISAPSVQMCGFQLSVSCKNSV